MKIPMERRDYDYFWKQIEGPVIGDRIWKPREDLLPEFSNPYCTAIDMTIIMGKFNVFQRALRDGDDYYLIQFKIRHGIGYSDARWMPATCLTNLGTRSILASFFETESSDTDSSDGPEDNDDDDDDGDEEFEILPFDHVEQDHEFFYPSSLHSDSDSIDVFPGSSSCIPTIPYNN